MRIIVIDDDAIVASSMKTILTCDDEVEVLALGYDGKEAGFLISGMETRYYFNGHSDEEDVRIGSCKGNKSF